MINKRNRIRIAIQKSGRLSDESFGLLNCCGIYIKSRKEQLFCHSTNFPLDLLLVRDDDIPNLVADGICDYGIVGTNLLQEKLLESNDSTNEIIIIRSLDFGFCRLSLATPKEFNYQYLKSLENCRVATSYPNLLAEFSTKNKINLEVVVLSGSVEIAPRLGIADAICDLVSTGGTLEANNLKEVATVFKSRAVLIKSPKYFVKEKQKTAEIFQNRVEGSYGGQNVKTNDNLE